MFTGIIEEIGTIKNITSSEYGKITIYAKKVLEDVNIGDSIATNGVCLTVTTFDSDSFTVDVMGETIRRTALSDLKCGSRVNLERAISASGRFGGHIVSGHIDGTGKIIDLKKEGNSVWVNISAEKGVLRYIVEKGSVAIDGISLTVANVDSDGFKVSLIPHTGSETTLLSKNIGDYVNLETDIIGKYIEKLLGNNIKQESKIDMAFLQRCGF